MLSAAQAERPATSASPASSASPSSTSAPQRNPVSPGADFTGNNTSGANTTGENAANGRQGTAAGNGTGGEAPKTVTDDDDRADSDDSATAMTEANTSVINSDGS